MKTFWSIIFGLAISLNCVVASDLYGPFDPDKARFELTASVWDNVVTSYGIRFRVDGGEVASRTTVGFFSSKVGALARMNIVVDNLNEQLYKSIGPVKFNLTEFKKGRLDKTGAFKKDILITTPPQEALGKKEEALRQIEEKVATRNSVSAVIMSAEKRNTSTNVTVGLQNIKGELPTNSTELVNQFESE